LIAQLLRPSTKAQRDLVLRLAVGGDAVPVAVDHGGELYRRAASAPFEGSAPVLEEAPCEAFTLITPQVTEGLLEQVGGVRALVGAQQYSERLKTLIYVVERIEPDAPAFVGERRIF
jgi:hypothetical protein